MKVLRLLLVLLTIAGVALNARAQSAKPASTAHVLTDGAYVHMMAMHHEEGIKMAQLASTKASNAEVKSLAARILAGQQKELKELQNLQTKVKADNPQEHAGMMKKMPMEHLEQMSGAAFDRMFLDMMSDHHRDAVKMSKEAKLDVAAVQDFARRTSQQQEKEVKEMQALRKQLG